MKRHKNGGPKPGECHFRQLANIGWANVANIEPTLNQHWACTKAYTGQSAQHMRSQSGHFSLEAVARCYIFEHEFSCVFILFRIQFKSIRNTKTVKIWVNIYLKISNYIAIVKNDYAYLYTALFSVVYF